MALGLRDRKLAIRTSAEKLCVQEEKEHYASARMGKSCKFEGGGKESVL